MEENYIKRMEKEYLISKACNVDVINKLGEKIVNEIVCSTIDRLAYLEVPAHRDLIHFHGYEISRESKDVIKYIDKEYNNKDYSNLVESSIEYLSINGDDTCEVNDRIVNGNVSISSKVVTEDNGVSTCTRTFNTKEEYDKDVILAIVEVNYIIIGENYLCREVNVSVYTIVEHSYEENTIANTFSKLLKDSLSYERIGKDVFSKKSINKVISNVFDSFDSDGDFIYKDKSNTDINIDIFHSEGLKPCNVFIFDSYDWDDGNNYYCDDCYLVCAGNKKIIDEEIVESYYKDSPKIKKLKGYKGYSIVSIDGERNDTFILRATSMEVFDTSARKYSIREINFELFLF